MQRIPIIGQAPGHSPFEAVQRAAIEAAGAALEVEHWERRPHQLASAIEQLRADEFAGAIIAQPHKEKAAGLVDTLSDDARHAGAVNVIVHDGDRLRGHDTDADGLRAGLGALLPTAQTAWPRHAVVLGAGGGARATVSVLVSAGVQRIAVFNRHLHRAEALVSHFSRRARGVDLRAMPWHPAILEAELAKAGLLVNASGLGAEQESSQVPSELLTDQHALLDLVLRRDTPLLREARQRGATVANGLATFLAASAATFGLLSGSKVAARVMRTALNAELSRPDDEAGVVGD